MAEPKGARWIFVAAALALALAYFGAVLVATGGAAGRSLRATALSIGPGIALAFAAYRLGRRLRWFDGPRARLAALHAALAVGYTLVWNAVTTVLYGVDQWAASGVMRVQVRPEIVGFGVFTGLLIYLGVAGAAFGLETSARLARAETLRVRAELAALRAHLNPHFLFNTLHTVLGLVRRDPALAEEALQDLGDVLRYSLNVQGGAEDVALADELEFVRRYLAIERVRLGERLRVEEDVAGAALACRLPAFTIQPIVENAIRYAVAPRAQGGRVRIAAARAGGELRVVISDDGAGAPPPAAGTGAGVGLALVRQRLEAAGAELATERGAEGFVVTLRVPQEAA